MRNFYDVLGVDPGADDERIKDAFHGLAKIFHPDLNSGDETAARRFKMISQAYDTLRDPRTRAAYELGLVHQRKNSRRRVGTAAMTGFLTSMLSTIIISLAMIWLLTNGGQVLPGGQDRDATRPKRPVSAPQEKSLHAHTGDLVRRLLPGRGGLQWQ
jgi:DnaJ-class molecular chaperone